MPLFQAFSLSKHYRARSGNAVRALQDVSLTIEPGSFTVIAGPSGSGKSTLLAILGGLERLTEGQVLFDDRDLDKCSGAELTRIRRRLGFVFQDFSLIQGLPVWENITYPLIPRGMRRREQFTLAESLLDQLGLADKRDVRPSELSGGEQQRVAIARALAVLPTAILADEPTSNLDPAASAVIIRLLREQNAKGTTIVVATHDPEWRALATNVINLERGRIASCS
jgi:putative ABC transport system ATP-binding protein